MLFKHLVIGFAERQGQIGQCLELISFYNTEGGISASDTRIEDSDELRLLGHHAGGRATHAIIYHILLAERKKFHKIVWKGLKVDVQLLFCLERVEVLL